MIAGSQTIAGTQAIAEVCFHMIADDRRTFCDLRSAIRDRLRSYGNQPLDIPCSLAREYIPVYSLYRVLSSPSICSRCSWVNAICEAISSLLGHQTHETIMQGGKSKRESSPWLKKKKKSPDLKNSGQQVFYCSNSCTMSLNIIIWTVFAAVR